MSITVCGSGDPCVYKNPAGEKEVQIRNRDGIRNMSAEKICYIESNNRKVILCAGGEKTECYGKIGELEAMLGDGFFRIHKGYLVNLRCVKRYGRTEVSMENGEVLPVSKYKYRDFVRTYREYISGGKEPQSKEEQHEDNDKHTE